MAHWNGRGAAFCCFMLTATLFGGIPPMSGLRQGSSHPGSDRYRQAHVEAELPCQGCGGQSTAYISSYLPSCLSLFQEPPPALCLCFQALRSLPSLVLAFIHSFPVPGSVEPPSFTSFIDPVGYTFLSTSLAANYHHRSEIPHTSLF